MAANGVTSTDDADMALSDGEKVVTMMDVLQEQEEFEDDVNAVLGASDDKNCTYSKGYVKRQAIYACLTCCPDAKTDPTKRAGVCLACSLNCHENHELVELYTKRNFRCDCGNPKFNGHSCQFTPDKSDLNYENKYNQNFSGVYCTCHRPYPDPECPEDEEIEMIQCIICEDWLHTTHLEATVPSNDQYAEMICKDCMEDNDFLHDYSDLVINKVDKEVQKIDPDLDVDIKSITNTTLNGNLENQTLTNGSTVAPSESKEICDKSDKVEDEKQQDQVAADIGMQTKPGESGDTRPSNENKDVNKSNIETDIAEEKKQETEKSEEPTNDQSSGDAKPEENPDSFTAEPSTDKQKDSDTNEQESKNDENSNDTAENKIDNSEIEQAKSSDNPAAENIEKMAEDNLLQDESETEHAKTSDNPDAENIEKMANLLQDESETEQAKASDNPDAENIGKMAEDNLIQDEKENNDSKDEISAKLDETIEQNVESSTKTTDTETAKSEENTDITEEKVLDEKSEDKKDIPFPETTDQNDNTDIDMEDDTNNKNDTSDKPNQESAESSENKRKLSEETEDVAAKRPKLVEYVCIRPRGVKKMFKGSTFWPANFRQKLCTCSECIAMYKDLAVLFLIDIDDTVTAYEALGKERTEGPSSQYEKGLQALSSLDRVQQINALTEYNKMRDKLLDFLKSFKDRKEIVKEEDIKAFFAGMKPKREPDGVYFCR